MDVKRSYLASQSLIRFLRSGQPDPRGPSSGTYFGTATTNVSMNSLFSTRSSFFTTSSKDRCERFPLGDHQLPCLQGTEGRVGLTLVYVEDSLDCP